MPQAASKQLSDEAIEKFLGGLWRLNRRIKQDIQPVLTEQYGLDQRRYMLLQAIYKGHIYPKHLAQEFDFPASMVSRYLDQLAGAGLVERTIDGRDSRRTRLSLTAEGERVRRDIVGRIKLDTAERLSGLSPAQLGALLDAIALLNERRDRPEPDLSGDRV